VNKKYGEEAKVAMGFQELMKQQGALCYPELDRCDLVVKRANGEIWAVEAKSKLNLKVFAQAFQHRKHAHRLFVVLPSRELQRATEGWASVAFVREISTRFGIGIYTVGVPHTYKKTWSEWSPGMPVPPCEVREYASADLFERADLSWDRLMVPEAETFSVAGGSGVKAFTDFRLWEIEVRKYVHENPGKTCREILQALRPPGVHKRTGKPLVVHKQDQEILWWNIRYRFQGFMHVPDPNDNTFATSTIWLSEDYYKANT
jgi:hypothetical protein